MFTGSVGIGWNWPLPGVPAETLLPLPAGFAAAGIAMPTSAANAAMRTVIQVNRRRVAALIGGPSGGPWLAEAKENLFSLVKLEIS
jgi:hypothetical protein